MDWSSSRRANPWSDDEKSFGGLRRVLNLTQQFKCVQQDDSQSSGELLSDSKFPSLRLISLLSEIQKKKAAINQIDLEIQKRLLAKESKDLTDVRILEKRISDINKLNTHLQSVVSKKDMLVSRLQQPHTREHLKIDASYRKFACEVIPGLVPVLSNLSEHLDTIEWASQVNIFDNQINSLLSDITDLMATIEGNVRSLLQMRSQVHEMHKERLKHTNH